VHADKLEAAYGREKYRRLVALKNKYDPKNVFRLNSEHQAHDLAPTRGVLATRPSRNEKQILRSAAPASAASE
jgi:hypothetical protein